MEFYAGQVFGIAYERDGIVEIDWVAGKGETEAAEEANARSKIHDMIIHCERMPWVNPAGRPDRRVPYACRYAKLDAGKIVEMMEAEKEIVDADRAPKESMEDRIKQLEAIIARAGLR